VRKKNKNVYREKELERVYQVKCSEIVGEKKLYKNRKIIY
jgi:hypothetical protein